MIYIAKKFKIMVKTLDFFRLYDIIDDVIL